MKTGLELRIGQNLTITPQLQQAIKLLQLSTFELNAEIDMALEANPLLEREEETSPEVTTDWEFTNFNSPKTASLDQINLDNLITSKKTLKEYLEWQLNLNTATDRDKYIGIAIIDAIDEDGYLTLSILEIYAGLTLELDDLDLEEVIAVQHAINQFDPLGVGSYSLQECLMIQLNSLPKDLLYLDLTKKIINEHINLLGTRNYKKLKSILNIDDHELQMILDIISKLHPKPGRLIAESDEEYTAPDVIVENINNSWHIRLNNHTLPRLKINSEYSNIISKSDDHKDKIYLKEKLNEAKWFLKSIQNRNETLLRVTTCIVQEQIEFLEKGAEFMKPMILQDIASKLDLHESTISRVTTKKYLDTPQGLFELKYFFSSHLATKSGSDCSSTSIKALIKKLINNENTQKPLSDQEIASVFVSKGVNIARRTVAKYRESLNIAPSNQRKKI
jgi:RNA polymerase sigma-54 factor